MTLFAAAFAAALAVTPSDRLAMADRLFNRGEYATAREEYLALRGEKSIDAAELGYRLTASARAVKDDAATRAAADAFLAANPAHKLADSVRFMKAMAGTDAERRAELPLLDRDDVAPAVRAEALVRLAQLGGDASLYERAVKLDPTGRFSSYARLMHAMRLHESRDEKDRRLAVQELMELVCGKDPQYARDALYLAATYSYAEGKYGECATLLKRYAQKYPGDARDRDVRRMLALSDLMAGKYASAIGFCTDDADETLVYVKATANDRLGNRAEAVAVAGRYLDGFPQGANRNAMELLIARAEFDEAMRTNGVRVAIAVGRRIVALSEGKNAADRLRLGWAYEKGGEAEQADAEYAGVARDFPKSASSADALYRRAMAQLRQEKWAAAELSLAEALASGHLAGERASLGWYWRGIAAMRAGHAAESLGFLRKALEAGLPLDESREARLLLADADYNSGRRDEAVKAYAELVRQGALERMSAAKTLAVGRLLSGDEAKACAKSLTGNESAEWRQAGWALAGDIAEAEENFVAAGDAYEKCLAEKCSTEAAASASLKLGGYLLRDGRPRDAEAAYKRAVDLNASNDEARAAAYLGLAKTARARDDAEAVRGYATVVATLFEKTASAAEAKEMLK